jgi:threonine aldolase
MGNKLIDLRSDTVTKPSPAMREFMLKAEVGDDVFGEDPTVNELQQRVARILKKDAALFVTSGTQANQVSLNAHTQPGQEVICDYHSHIFNYEAGAAGMLSGIQLHPLPGHNGHPSLEQIAEVIRPPDDHYPQTRLICLENTHNRAGGTILPLAELKRISGFARGLDLKMHLDGARLWNAVVATGITPAEYAQHFDSVSVCFSKGLGAPIGSMVAGSRDFIQRVHYYRKAYGGGTRQVGILAAACLYALDHNLERLAEDHQHARMLAEALNSCKGFKVDLQAVQTNIVIAEVHGKNQTAPGVVEVLRAHGILALPFSNTKIRFVTHLDVSPAEIEQCTGVLKKIFN